MRGYELIKLGLYKHYKGNYYQVIGIAKHEESHENMVVYRELYGEYALWVRRLDRFLEDVVHDGREVPRFKFIKELDTKPQILEDKEKTVE
jgi:hypothetical protein